MSERILKALMQLFAIIARVDEDIDNDCPVTSEQGRKIVESFLSQELSQSDVQEYLDVFDEFLIGFQGSSKKKDGKRKKTSVHSVKVLRICTQINEELTQRQKIIVLVRILEFIARTFFATRKLNSGLSIVIKISGLYSRTASTV